MRRLGMLNLKNWRLDMQRCLLEIERVEDMKGSKVSSINSAFVIQIINLTRDIEREFNSH